MPLWHPTLGIAPETIIKPPENAYTHTLYDAMRESRPMGRNMYGKLVGSKPEKKGEAESDDEQK